MRQIQGTLFYWLTISRRSVNLINLNLKLRCGSRSGQTLTRAAKSPMPRRPLLPAADQGIAEPGASPLRSVCPRADSWTTSHTKPTHPTAIPPVYGSDFHPAGVQESWRLRDFRRSSAVTPRSWPKCHWFFLDLHFRVIFLIVPCSFFFFGFFLFYFFWGVDTGHFLFLYFAPLSP